MTHPAAIRFTETDLDRLVAHPGRIALLADGPTGMTPAARRLDRAMKGHSPGRWLRTRSAS
ncbi:hypothetical protein MASR1M32_21410 [Rhodobacter sp.]